MWGENGLCQGRQPSLGHQSFPSENCLSNANLGKYRYDNVAAVHMKSMNGVNLIVLKKGTHYSVTVKQI